MTHEANEETAAEGLARDDGPLAWSDPSGAPPRHQDASLLPHTAAHPGEVTQDQIKRNIRQQRIGPFLRRTSAKIPVREVSLRRLCCRRRCAGPHREWVTIHEKNFRFLRAPTRPARRVGVFCAPRGSPLNLAHSLPSQTSQPACGAILRRSITFCSCCSTIVSSSGMFRSWG